jgi:hypothetical protein
VGLCRDPDLCSRIQGFAQQSSNVIAHIGPNLTPEIDLERYIDQAHGIILPYRNILNSGSAFFALSRNRPILAPRIGSLPELQDEVGKEWVSLFDGQISQEILKTFADWLRQRDPKSDCNLSRFNWDRIGEELSDFIKHLHE